MIKPLVYLACPYSGDHHTVAHRVREFALTAARLEKEGEVHVVSPVMNHLLLQYSDLPGDWNFWKSYSLTLLRRCDHLYVLKLPGWDVSTGVKGEIEFATEQGMPITYLEPENSP